MSAYEVGKYYQVPCVLQVINANGKVPRSRLVPIIGPLHEDREFFNFPHQHFHPDPRFMSQALLKWYMPRWAVSRYSLPLPQEAMRVPLAIEGFPARVASPEPVLRWRKCQREMPDWPAFVDGWLTSGHRKLEAAYQDCRLKLDHPVCPHRGILLEGLPVKDGLVICPGHGLQWDLRTGELVPREMPKWFLHDSLTGTVVPQEGGRP